MATCVACASDDARRDAFFYEWRDRRWWIYRCPDCTHQFVYPSVAAEEMAAIYGDHYFAANGDWAASHFEGQGYRDAEAKLRDEARQVLGMLPVNAGVRLLDIGCAGGVFLDEARRKGFEVAGIEYNASMAQDARARYGLDVHQGTIESVPLDRYPAGSFDVVTVLDVLEHVPSPRAAMDRIGTWAKDNAVLLIRGPLQNSRAGALKEGLRRLLGRTKQLPGYPLDANVWNKRSLSQLLSSQRFAPARWINETPAFANLVALRSVDSQLDLEARRAHRAEQPAEREYGVA
jgi:SAM-dependent methyltransferase